MVVNKNCYNSVVGNKMIIFSLIMQQKWFWIICLVFFFIRIVIECERKYEFEDLFKKTLKRIGIWFILTIMWGQNYVNDETMIALIIFTYFYIAYLATEKFKRTGGYTNSLLLLINCFMVSSLSFAPWFLSIIQAVVICFISIWICMHLGEKKRDLADIITVCLESAVISLILYFGSLKSIYYTLFYLCLEESVLNAINKGIRRLVQIHYNEEDYEWNY